MFLRTKYLTTVGLFIAFQCSAFTVINQTDKEMVVRLTEAQRPDADKPGELNAPVPINDNPQEIKVPAKSAVQVDLVKECPVLLVGIITETIKKGWFKEQRTTRTRETCYEPYDYHPGENSCTINNNWGLVIHKPLPTANLDPLRSDYAHQSFYRRMAQENGYGIKCLHPILLAKVVSMDELPEELT